MAVEVVAAVGGGSDSSSSGSLSPPTDLPAPLPRPTSPPHLLQETNTLKGQVTSCPNCGTMYTSEQVNGSKLVSKLANSVERYHATSRTLLSSAMLGPLHPDSKNCLLTTADLLTYRSTVSSGGRGRARVRGRAWWRSTWLARRMTEAGAPACARACAAPCRFCVCVSHIFRRFNMYRTISARKSI